MGIFRDADKDIDTSGLEEESYERMFMKIGRDFVHKEDFYRVIAHILNIIDPDGLSPVDFRSDAGARKRATEYKQLIDSGTDGSTIYKDLIDLSE